MPDSIESLELDKIHNALGHTKNYTDGKKGMMLMSILLFSFIICGALYSEEYIMFQFVLLLSVVSFIIPIAGITINAISSKEFFITSMMDGAKNLTNSKYMIIINRVIECVKIVIVSLVVYNHFIG